MPTLIFKETEACNSNCIYCDVIARKKPKTVSFERLEKVFIYINEYLEKYKEEYDLLSSQFLSKNNISTDSIKRKFLFVMKYVTYIISITLVNGFSFIFTPTTYTFCCSLHIALSSTIRLR